MHLAVRVDAQGREVAARCGGSLQIVDSIAGIPGLGRARRSAARRQQALAELSATQREPRRRASPSP